MFKVGDKFIIELEKEHCNSDCSYYKIKGLHMTINEVQLTALDRCGETDEKEAYKKGYAEAMKEAQKAIRTFLTMDCENREKYFDDKYAITEIFGTYDFREIVEKLQRYEEEQSKIRVGDEVEIVGLGSKAVVTLVHEYEKRVFVLYYDGSTDEFTDRAELRKTGRHFDEVEKLIEILKGGENSDEISF